MKSRALCIFLVYFLTQINFTAFAQEKQSAIYDAIALLNAEHGINAILMPAPYGYQVIDPIKGTILLSSNTGNLPDSFTNNLVASQTIILKILARNAGLPEDTTLDVIKNAYKENPFLNGIFNNSPARLISGSGSLPSSISSIPASGNSGAAATNILNNLANGATDFLTQRAEEEISITVFEQLQKFIGHYPEFKILFPKTTGVIEPVTPSEYTKALNSLKDALQGDLDGIPSRVPALYTLPRYQILNQEVPALTLIFSASNIISEIHGKNGLSKSLHDIDTSEYLQAHNNYASFIHVLSLTSDDLRKKLLSQDESEEFDYISSKEINIVTNQDPINKARLATFFFGLLYQHCNKVPLWTSTGQESVADLLGPLASSPSIGNFLDKITCTTTSLQNLASQLKTIKNKDEAEEEITGKTSFSIERFSLYNRLIDTALQLCQPYISDLNTKDNSLKQEFQQIYNYWPSFANDGIDMVQAFSQKSYSLAIQDLSNSLQIVSQYMDSKKSDKAYSNLVQTNLKTILNPLDSVVNVQIALITIQINSLPNALKASSTEIGSAIKEKQQFLKDELTALRSQKADLDWQIKNPDKALFGISKVLEYYNLFAVLSQANNSQEVETLLETYTLPSGSSRIKKETDFNIAVNAYVGGFFARTSSSGSGFNNQYGLTVPIGFTISHGFAKAGSISLFAGAFDLGGILQYKLNSQGAYEQNINLVGLVSPSVHIVYGFPFYLPLSIGAGCQWTTPTSTTSNNINLESHFNMFIAIDIPLFNLSVIKKQTNK